MRVFVTHRPGGAYGFITDAWINAFRSKGHDVRRWDGLEESWFSFGPDLYCACSGHRQPIPAKRSTKVAIHVNPYGPIDVAGINESQNAIDWTLAQRPDAVFGYGFEDDRLLWCYWTDRHGIPWVPMPTAGDKVLYNQEADETAKQYDMVYLGGRWSYKAQSIDPYLFPTIDQPGVTYKLYGWGEWPSRYCSGTLADDKVAAFFQSGRVAPCISEPHTQRYGIDVPERVWKVALSGALAIHDPVPSLRNQCKSIIIAQNPTDYSKLCLYYSRAVNAEERVAKVKEQRAEILANHTYHHRLAGLLRAVGFTDAADDMLT